MRRRLLFVTRHTPLPWEDGAGAYLHDIARYLAAASGIEVEILWLKPHDHLLWQGVYRLPAAFSPSVRLHLPDAVRVGRRYIFPRIYWLPFKARTLHRLRVAATALGFAPRRRVKPVITGAPDPIAPSWSAPPTPAERSLVARMVRERRPDTVVACYAWLCPLFAEPALGAVGKVCLTYDVAWKRSALETRPTTEERITPECEAGWLRLVSHVIAITPDDADELSRLAPEAEILLAAKAFRTTGTTTAPDAGPRLAFVGSGNAFNAEGLSWFLTEVWPRIRAKRPDCSLEVAGNIDRTVALRPEGVHFLGRVDDLAAVYARATVAIVPLLRASGLNIKLVEAAAHGKAIVATPIALSSSAELARSSLAAETPEAFAATTLRLLADPDLRRHAEAASRETVRRHFSPEACYGPLADRLSHPLPSRDPQRVAAHPTPVA